MYIAVCDDQTEELGSLTELIGAWEEDRGTPVRVKSFRSAAALLDAARHERFTLYLLDIMMPGLNGMDAAREIRGFDKAADIIFLTSSPGFAYDSYSVQALEYLLKPIRTKTLYPILDRLELRERRPQEALTLRTGGIIVRVPFSQLTYVEVNGKHLYFNLADGQVREVVGSRIPCLRGRSLCASTAPTSSICCRSRSFRPPACVPFRGASCRSHACYTPSFKRTI